ncbi:MAG: hypothetical protein ACRC33_31130, partial [Gemmataceae bacterium]
RFSTLASDQLTWQEAGCLATFLLTVFLWGVGDMGINSFSHSQLTGGSEPVRLRFRQQYLLDLILVVLHGGILLGSAWLCLGHPALYTWSLLLLAGLNMVWLPLKIDQFNFVAEQAADEETRQRASRCRSAMLNWMSINGAYLCVTAFIVNPVVVPLPLDLLQPVCLALALVRALGDLLVCYPYYQAVLTSAIEQNRVPPSPPPIVANVPAPKKRRGRGTP